MTLDADSIVTGAVSVTRRYGIISNAVAQCVRNGLICAGGKCGRILVHYRRFRGGEQLFTDFVDVEEGNVVINLR